MVRRYRDFLVSNDGMQWIVQKERMGKDKDGNDKIMLGNKSYFVTMESLVSHINNGDLMDFFNARGASVFDALGFDEVEPREKEEVKNV